jgi:hypothetical protein
MKKRDIFIKTIASVSGKPEGEIAKMLDSFCAANPKAAQGFDVDVPEDEAEKMLKDFRAEAPGIFAWLVRGAMDVAAHESKTVH